MWITNLRVVQVSILLRLDDARKKRVSRDISLAHGREVANDDMVLLLPKVTVCTAGYKARKFVCANEKARVGQKPHACWRACM